MKEKSGIMIDKRVKRFVEDCVAWKGGIYSLHLSDIDETFWFSSKERVQEFLNVQAHERFADKSLRKGYFCYVDDEANIPRYVIRYDIKKVNRGRIEEWKACVYEPKDGDVVFQI